MNKVATAPCENPHTESLLAVRTPKKDCVRQYIEQFEQSAASLGLGITPEFLIRIGVAQKSLGEGTDPISILNAVGAEIFREDLRESASRDVASLLSKSVEFEGPRVGG